MCYLFKLSVSNCLGGANYESAQGKVKSIVETYPLADAPKAYQPVVDGKARFRAVLTM
jgi:D-arabinose 1-dehydrogenase-like Zn-dependent alcohol dehydrogenase